MNTEIPTAMTVLGPISADKLGFTLMHEHLLLDARDAYFDPARLADSSEASRKLAMNILGNLRWDPGAYEDNLVIDDIDAVVEEVAGFRRAGGGTIVDMTTIGLRPRPTDVAEIAYRTGTTVIHGCGFYLHRTHPAWLEDASVELITEAILRDLREGIGGTKIRAGIVGEIGTGHPPTKRELKVVAAAARAAATAGVSLNIHLDSFGTDALAVLDVVERAGHDPARTIFSHLDLHLDVDYHLDILRRGAVGSYDCFGAETYNLGRIDVRDPSDQERVNALAVLLEAGYSGQLVLSHDVYTKQQMTAFGGMGFAHLPGRILPVLQERFGEGICAALTIENPRRLLSVHSVKPLVRA